MSLEEPLEWMAPSAWELAQPHATFVLYEVVPSALEIVMLGFALAWALRESAADLLEARRKTPSSSKHLQRHANPERLVEETRRRLPSATITSDREHPNYPMQPRIVPPETGGRNGRT